jgi:hypothetical protein
MEKQITENEENNTEANNDQLHPIQLRLKKDVIFEMSVSAKDCIIDLRTFVADLPSLYFHPSFHFEFEGHKINE